MSDDDIRKMAKEFCDKWLPKWEVYCAVCKACNCKENNNCIKCKSQLPHKN